MLRDEMKFKVDIPRTDTVTRRFEVTAFDADHAREIALALEEQNELGQSYPVDGIGGVDHEQVTVEMEPFQVLDLVDYRTGLFRPYRRIVA
jgi:hypothetical protein